jgi:hypothetical protein
LNDRQDGNRPEPRRGPGIREQVFRLNLGYLLAARDVLQSGEAPAAEVLFGLEEPLSEWLRLASVEALVNLARSPAAVFRLRLPEQSAEKLLAACGGEPDQRWIAAMHLSLLSSGAPDGTG